MMKRTMRSVLAATAAAVFMISPVFSIPAKAAANDGEEEVVLRVSNWEEYIDEGEWDEEETIDLESGDILGENSLVDDFEDWYYETYGIRCRVEYSTFGTNEDLYNMLTIGDVYDLVCPSEYMIMKLMSEDMLEPLSDEFFDTDNELNYYINGVSPYIRSIFETHEINGETWDRYMAGYMWGVTGFVYNPDEITREETATWKLFSNTDYRRQITIKDNVRDSYFSSVGALRSDYLTSEEFLNDPDYAMKLQDIMNDVSEETIDEVQDYLQMIRGNMYSFETDSGKADMITGKVVANYQWSGDAVYTMDQAEEDDYYLNFAVPVESTNVYFDGWAMLKNGVREDARKKHAAEAFINFLSRPDNVVRNMYYIGYTSCISGGDDPTVFEYLDWSYGAEEDEEEVVDYSVAHFFADEDDDPEDFVLTVPEEQLDRQLIAQYPSEDILHRATIMIYFDKAANERINKMWIRVRCFNLENIPVVIPLTASILIAAAVIYLLVKKYRKH